MRLKGQWGTRMNAAGAVLGYGGGIIVAYSGAKILADVPFHASRSEELLWPVVGITLAFSSFHLLSIGGWCLDRFAVLRRGQSGA